MLAKSKINEMDALGDHNQHWKSGVPDEMTKKKALYDASFVGLMAFVFSSFVLWQLFQRIGPTGNDFEPLASILPITPFVLSGAAGLMIFSVARQILNSRVEDDDTEKSNDKG